MPAFLADMVAKGFWWAILAALIFGISFGIVGGILSALVNKVLGKIIQSVPGTFFLFYIWHIRGGVGWLILAIISVFGLILSIVGLIKPKTGKSEVSSQPAGNPGSTAASVPHMKLSLQSDLLTYINECLSTIVGYENTAITAYGGASGQNYAGDLELYKALTDTVIPNYQKLVEGLSQFPAKLKTNEVRELNAKYIEAAKTYMTGFLMLKNMLDNQDASKMEEVNSILEKGQMLVGKWSAEFQSMCRENGVQMQ